MHFVGTLSFEWNQTLLCFLLQINLVYNHFAVFGNSTTANNSLRWYSLKPLRQKIWHLNTKLKALIYASNWSTKQFISKRAAFHKCFLELKENTGAFCKKSWLSFLFLIYYGHETYLNEEYIIWALVSLIKLISSLFSCISVQMN